MSVIDVSITKVNGNFVATPDPAQPSKSAGNTVKWHNNTDVDITITFAASPFPDKDFPIEPGKHKDSGSIKVNAGTTWKYNITGGGIVTDPEIIVQP